MSDSTTTTTTTIPTSSRTTERDAERAIALLRFEVASGLIASELLESLQDLVHELVLDSVNANGSGAALAMSEALIRGFIACGHRESVTAWIDDWATSRAQAEAYGRLQDATEVYRAAKDAAKDDNFDDEYEQLGELGACDSPGGAEYERVKQEWIDAGRPTEIAAFIRRRANVASGGES